MKQFISKTLFAVSLSSLLIVPVSVSAEEPVDGISAHASSGGKRAAEKKVTSGHTIKNVNNVDAVDQVKKRSSNATAEAGPSSSVPTAESGSGGGSGKLKESE